jgi:WD40 repeat protein
MLKNHNHWASSVTFSHDLVRLASGTSDHTVKIWEMNSGECLLTLEGHSRFIISVAFSHDWTRLASGSSDYMVKIWEVSSGECLQTLESYSRFINSVIFSHDSARLVSGSDNNTVYQGVGLSLDDKWITYNAGNLLWIPLEYRPSHFVVSKKYDWYWYCSWKGMDM